MLRITPFFCNFANEMGWIVVYKKEIGNTLHSAEDVRQTLLVRVAAARDGVFRFHLNEKIKRWKTQQQLIHYPLPGSRS